MMLLTVIIGSRTFAQGYSSGLNLIDQTKKSDRAKEVVRHNEYIRTGYEKGIFFSNPLLLNGKPLDFNEFTIGSIGELTVIKGATITGKTTQVPFYVYLRRNGFKVLIPGRGLPEPKQLKISIMEILKHAEQGDHLVIEAVNKEDGPVKTILKLLGDGC